MQLFVDMDGVLADFDRHYFDTFGVKPSKEADNVDWGAVRQVHGFYKAIPPMPDLPALWGIIAPLQPTVLTGIPESVPDAAANKVGWVRKHLGPSVPVICCRSRNKSLHAEPGDVLIDDWEKYRWLWEARGCRWITHRSAAETIAELRAMGIIP